MKNPTPWKVVSSRFRISCSPVLVEIHDACDNPVLPWSAFDHLPSLRERRALAARIVKAVNGAATPEHKDKD